jgi:inosine-uridine nucleoside N-ribohydrolase
MEAEQVRRRFQTELLRPVLDFAEVWFQRAGGITFHDPLAAVTLFEPKVCTFQRGIVMVDLSSPENAGLTLWDPEGVDSEHEVAVQVDPARFFDHYFSIVR